MNQREEKPSHHFFSKYSQGKSFCLFSAIVVVFFVSVFCLCNFTSLRLVVNVKNISLMIFPEWSDWSVCSQGETRRQRSSIALGSSIQRKFCHTTQLSEVDCEISNMVLVRMCPLVCDYASLTSLNRIQINLPLQNARSGGRVCPSIPISSEPCSTSSNIHASCVFSSKQILLSPMTLPSNDGTFPSISKKPFIRQVLLKNGLFQIQGQLFQKRSITCKNTFSRIRSPKIPNFSDNRIVYSMNEKSFLRVIDVRIGTYASLGVPVDDVPLECLTFTISDHFLMRDFLSFPHFTLSNCDLSDSGCDLVRETEFLFEHIITSSFLSTVDKRSSLPKQCVFVDFHLSCISESSSPPDSSPWKTSFTAPSTLFFKPKGLLHSISRARRDFQISSLSESGRVDVQKMNLKEDVLSEGFLNLSSLTVDSSEALISKGFGWAGCLKRCDELSVLCDAFIWRMGEVGRQDFEGNPVSDSNLDGESFSSLYYQSTTTKANREFPVPNEQYSVVPQCTLLASSRRISFILQMHTDAKTKKQNNDDSYENFSFLELDYMIDHLQKIFQDQGLRNIDGSHSINQTTIIQYSKDLQTFIPSSSSSTSSTTFSQGNETTYSIYPSVHSKTAIPMIGISKRILKKSESSIKNKTFLPLESQKEFKTIKLLPLSSFVEIPTLYKDTLITQILSSSPPSVLSVEDGGLSYSFGFVLKDCDESDILVSINLITNSFASNSKNETLFSFTFYQSRETSFFSSSNSSDTLACFLEDECTSPRDSIVFTPSTDERTTIVIYNKKNGKVLFNGGIGELFVGTNAIIFQLGEHITAAQTEPNEDTFPDDITVEFMKSRYNETLSILAETNNTNSLSGIGDSVFSSLKEQITTISSSFTEFSTSKRNNCIFTSHALINKSTQIRLLVQKLINSFGDVPLSSLSQSSSSTLDDSWKIFEILDSGVERNLKFIHPSQNPFEGHIFILDDDDEIQHFFRSENVTCTRFKSELEGLMFSSIASAFPKFSTTGESKLKSLFAFFDWQRRELFLSQKIFDFTSKMTKIITFKKNNDQILQTQNACPKVMFDSKWVTIRSVSSLTTPLELKNRLQNPDDYETPLKTRIKDVLRFDEGISAVTKRFVFSFSECQELCEVSAICTHWNMKRKSALDGSGFCFLFNSNSIEPLFFKPFQADDMAGLPGIFQEVLSDVQQNWSDTSSCKPSRIPLNQVFFPRGTFDAVQGNVSLAFELRTHSVLMKRFIEDASDSLLEPLCCGQSKHIDQRSSLFSTVRESVFGLNGVVGGIFTRRVFKGREEDVDVSRRCLLECRKTPCLGIVVYPSDGACAIVGGDTLGRGSDGFYDLAASFSLQHFSSNDLTSVGGVCAAGGIFWIGGNLINTIDAPDWKSCAQICHINQACVVWRWNTNGHCELRGETQVPIINNVPGWVGGVREREGNCLMNEDERTAGWKGEDWNYLQDFTETIVSEMLGDDSGFSLPGRSASVQQFSNINSMVVDDSFEKSFPVNRPKLLTISIF
eukprot:GDKJ01039394.1.p1 GENE.GDKJ01039394.1~~GDKJ01039394.1.p1  ORF type:complete len:1507 (+),score=268.34 GDKJ01039394.1:49-4569(+)